MRVHKRNVSLTALLLAGIITAGFMLVPWLNRSSVLGLFYFPSILLSVALTALFGGHGHSPSAAAGYSSFVAYTLLYWVVFLVVYALLWELHLLRQAYGHLTQAKEHLLSRAEDAPAALATIGRAIVQVEGRRRRHFLLRDTDELDLSLPPDRLAAIAITKAGNRPPVKGLLKRFEARLRAEGGPERAAALMTKLRDHARQLAANDQARPGAAP